MGQAQKNQRAAIQQDRCGRMVDVLMGVAEPSLAEAVAKGMTGAEDMSSTEVVQFRLYCHARFAMSEDAFYQHRAGLLNEEAFNAFIATFGGAFGSPGVRVMWRWLKGGHAPEFVDFVDRLMARTPVLPTFDDLGRWRAEVAAEKLPAAA
jgi:hypothetical protein